MDWNHTIKVAAVCLALLPGWSPGTGQASSGAAPLPEQSWSFDGIFGRFDQGALKRGSKVVLEACLGCHSVKLIKFDQLRVIGFSEVEVKALAEAAGKTKKDKILSGMEPDAAKEAFGVVPPDLSLMTKARKGYENYLYGMLTGYLSDEESALVDKAMADGKLSPEEVGQIAAALHLDPHRPEKVTEVATRIRKGDSFNKYFPGNFLAMPKPLNAGQVSYADGTKNSLEQLSRDAVTFLAWASEPTQTERKSVGLVVMIYLLIFTVMLYAVKRRVWAKVH